VFNVCKGPPIRPPSLLYSPSHPPMHNASEALPHLCFLSSSPISLVFNAMRPSFSWSLTLVPVRPHLYLTHLVLLVAAHPVTSLVVYMFKVHHPPLSPIIVAHPPTTHLCLMCSRSLSTSLSPPCISPTCSDLVRSAPTCRASHLCILHLAMSPALHVLHTSLGPGGSLPCGDFSPLHPTHLSMAPPLCWEGLAHVKTQAREGRNTQKV